MIGVNENMSKNSSYIFVLLGVTIFSTYEVVGKMAGYQIPVVSMTGIRFLIGGFLLLPMALTEKKNDFHFNLTNVRKILTVGVLNVAISMVLLQLSVYYGKAVLAAIIFSANPVFVEFLICFLSVKNYQS